MRILSVRRCRLLVPVLVAAATGVVGTTRSEGFDRGRATSQLSKLEYVFPDQSIVLYNAVPPFQQVGAIALPQLRGVRGVAGTARRRVLYVSYGPDSDAGHGHLLAFDLVSARVMWDRSYPFGIDSMAISPDGSRIYMPTGELSSGASWKVLDTQKGDVIATIVGGRGPHNTIVGASGRWLYMGPRGDDYLYIASTATNRTVGKVGPLINTVRPFTVNGSETLVYTTATGFLGFQVSSLKTGRVLYTVRVRGFSWDPATFAPSAPSHGIALSPNGKRLWLLDAPNGYVHEFDVSRSASRRPRQVANVRLSAAMTGNEAPCTYDCARDGWLQLGRDGRYLFVGDSGNVVDTRTRRVVATLPALRNSRKALEIWRLGSAPVYVGSRSSIGRPSAGRKHRLRTTLEPRASAAAGEAPQRSRPNPTSSPQRRSSSNAGVR